MLKDKRFEKKKKALQFIHWCKDNKSDAEYGLTNIELRLEIL